jgi:excinuclease ABC subunit A
VVTGVSGSGKSSLVFDTLYAEGQRRYVQSLSTYARLFLAQMERPDVDSISDIPPAIALEQRNSIKNARSTVGTITEIHDYLRLLLTHAGETSCLDCGTPVRRDTPETAAAEVAAFPTGTKALIHTRVAFHGVDKAQALSALARQGYRRVIFDGRVVDMDDVPAELLSIDAVDVLIDRITIDPDRIGRVREALERGFEIGRGSVTATVDLAEPVTRKFDNRFSCVRCGREFTPPTPHLFSFNSPLGACPKCEGFGRIVDIDLDKVIPNKRLSLRDGAVVVWNTPAYAELRDEFLQAATRRGYSTELPYSQLSQEAQRWIVEGDRETPGIQGFFEWLEARRYKTHVRILLARYRSYRTCPACNGARLKPEALAVKIGQHSIASLCALSIRDLKSTISRLRLAPAMRARVEAVLRELRNRISYLLEVGLGYLTLDRQARTLSGGEAQRIHLAAALGSALTDTLYALDEPTVGLHPRDAGKLLKVLQHLTSMGNTVVVVEHDPSLIDGADHVVDLGPGGGSQGGEILYEGKPSGLTGQSAATGRLLLIRTLHRQKKRRTERSSGQIVIHGARENNLQLERVEIPLGRMVCVTGVSGSGKSTLVEKVLFENYLRERGLGGQEAGACDRIEGFDRVAEIFMMSQAPIGRSLRSNPATYIKCYDEIRKLFASTAAARQQKVTAASFSFNTIGGRCERCQGTGSVTIEMHFMADIEVPCDECNGQRFKRNVLDVRYRNASINEVLRMTVDDAKQFFQDRPAIRAKLDCLVSVGLSYLTLGQATSTLSGGEAQRLKLAGFLSEESRSQGSLFIFDEPTTGLHLQDVHNLISVLDGLVERGHTVLVVEHHTDFISHADYVIDLGPEGGDEGGRLVACGSPVEVAEVAESRTGRELRSLLGLKRSGAQTG